MKYIPEVPPVEYDPEWLRRELEKIHQTFEVRDELLLAPQVRAPSPARVGTIANADGESWNPGDGAGLYEMTKTGWRKL